MHTNICILILLDIFPPIIDPAGYNASIIEEEVELRCVVPADASSFLWIINGSSNLTLREPGIRQGNISKNGDHQISSIFIKTIIENNNTTLQCNATFISSPFVLISEKVIFRVQGKCIFWILVNTFIIPLGDEIR